MEISNIHRQSSDLQIGVYMILESCMCSIGSVGCWRLLLRTLRIVLTFECERGLLKINSCGIYHIAGISGGKKFVFFMVGKQMTKYTHRGLMHVQLSWHSACGVPQNFLPRTSKTFIIHENFTPPPPPPKKYLLYGMYL